MEELSRQEENYRTELKIQAYRERLSQALEDNADLRVELTILNQQLQEALRNAKEPAEDS